MKRHLLAIAMGVFPGLMLGLYFRPSQQTTTTGTRTAIDIPKPSSPQLEPGVKSWQDLASHMPGAVGKLQAYAALQDLTSADCATTLNVLLAGQRNDALQQALLNRWFDVDPPAAMQWTKNLIEPHTLDDAAMFALTSAWAARDPAGYFTWWHDQMQSQLDDDSGGLEGWFPEDALAAIDLKLSVELMLVRAIGSSYGREMPNARIGAAIRTAADAAAVGQVLAQHQAKLLAEPRNLYDARDILNLLRERWIALDPKAWRQWAADHPALTKNIQTQVFSEHQLSFASAVDPNAAAEYWLSAQDEGSKASRMEIIIKKWAASDLNAAGTWLNSQAKDATAWPAIEAFAMVAASHDPVASFAWASIIEDENMRARTERNVFLKWNAIDATAADAWLQAADWPEVRKQAVREMAAAQ